jgi:hypothetical protein
MIGFTLGGFLLSLGMAFVFVAAISAHTDDGGWLDRLLARRKDDQI